MDEEMKELFDVMDKNRLKGHEQLFRSELLDYIAYFAPISIADRPLLFFYDYDERAIRNVCDQMGYTIISIDKELIPLKPWKQSTLIRIVPKKK